jgi:pimeloyl-ACP methyl ester carboxylesterase
VSETTLLLPGWGTHPERLGPLAERVRAAGRSTRLVSYTPDGTIDALARRVRDLAPDGPLHLVGHSLGGLVVAAAALRHLTGRVRTVTTVNAPWRGTWVAYTGDTTLTRELRWGAPALDALRDELAAHLADEDGPRWLVLGMAGDLATPATTSLTVPRGPRLERRLLPLAGHSQSLLAPRLHDVVAAHVDRAGVAQRPPADRTAASG